MPTSSSANSSAASRRTASSRGSELTAPTSVESKGSGSGTKRKAIEEKEEEERPKNKLPKTKLSKDKRSKHKVSKGKKAKGKRATTTKKSKKASKAAKEVESAVEDTDAVQDTEDPEESEYEDPDNTPFSFAPSEQKIVKVEDLDLDKSYLLEYLSSLEEPEKEERPERQTRWTHKGPEPLLDVTKLPEGWNAREPDLDPNDIEAQITRCKERIEDNIMPFLFEHRLEEYEARKSNARALVACEKPEIDMATLQRMECLRFMESELEVEGKDPLGQLPNVRAILMAYRKSRLMWTGNGLVTYWSRGQQLCQPRPLNWDEFNAINAKHNGHESFWVEGLGGPGPSIMMPSLTIPFVADFGVWSYNIAVRLPGRNWWCELDFIHDTGSTSLALNEMDLPAIIGPHRNPIPTLGTASVLTGNGSVLRRVILAEITLLDKSGRRMCPWIRIHALVNDIAAVPGTRYPRLDGGTLTHMFYFLTVPSERHEMIISDSRFTLLPAPASMAFRENAPFNPTVATPGGDPYIFPPRVLPVEEPVYAAGERAMPEEPRGWGW